MYGKTDLQAKQSLGHIVLTIAAVFSFFSDRILTVTYSRFICGNERWVVLCFYIISSSTGFQSIRNLPTYTHSKYLLPSYCKKRKNTIQLSFGRLNGWRTFQPRTFQPQASTPDLSTPDFSTMNSSTINFPTLDFSTPNIFAVHRGKWMHKSTKYEKTHSQCGFVGFQTHGAYSTIP